MNLCTAVREVPQNNLTNDFTNDDNFHHKM